MAVLRQVLDMKTPEFAEVCGLSLSAIEKLETGRLKLSDEVAFRIAQETGVEAWLLAGDVAAPPRRLAKGSRERIGKGEYRTIEYGERLQPEVFAEWRARGSKVSPIWNPEAEAARLAGIIARAIRKGRSVYAKYRIDKLLDELEAEYGMDEKKRRWVEESLRNAPKP